MPTAGTRPNLEGAAARPRVARRRRHHPNGHAGGHDAKRADACGAGARPHVPQLVADCRDRRSLAMDELITRYIGDLTARVSGPMWFRLILQPTMAIIFAFRAGLKDARTGQPAFFRAVAEESGAPARPASRRMEGRRESVYNRLRTGHGLSAATAPLVLPVAGADHRVRAGVPSLPLAQRAFQEARRFVVAAIVDTGTRLAVDRTRLAHERTLMAWVRTATS